VPHPRPQLRREHWRSLDGPWRFSQDATGHPERVRYTCEICVPYAPETPRSGVGHATGRVAWYERTVDITPDRPGPNERLLLHFGAVDDRCQVWVNGTPACTHDTSYTGFTIDTSPYLAGDTLTISVRVEDDPLDLHKPRGKQDWESEPHSIWYPRTTGIWQTVWLERVPAARVERVRWTPNVERFEIRYDALLTCDTPGLDVRVTLRAHGRVLARHTAAAHAGRASGVIALPDPGIDDARDHLLWSPEHPQLIDATVELLTEERAVLDTAVSYTALRSVGTERGRFLLNGRPYYLRMVLDQGYWPEGGLTATDDELRADVELTKRLGFNGARKHQKIEDPRYLYWCDRLGLLVWAELPSAYAFSDRSVDRLTRQWLRVIERDYSHPCVAAWVPFNESWGVPELPRDTRHRDLVRALYHLTKALDDTRPVIGNDGWEHTVTDILSIHDYTTDPDELHARYAHEDTLPAALRDFRPGGRAVTLDDFRHAQQPVMLTEFGGIACILDAGDGWGYSTAENAALFMEQYAELMKAIHASKGLAGFCYTQLTDTYQEKNGLLTMHREPKVDAVALAVITRGNNSSTRQLSVLGHNERWIKKEALYEEARR